MKFSAFVRIALLFGGLLLLIEAFCWWAGEDRNWARAFWTWGWSCCVLMYAWSVAPRYVPPADVDELERWRLAWNEHDRWLGEFEDVSLALKNMRAQAKGEALSMLWPPGAAGPWEISRLREVLRQRQLIGKAKP